MREVWRCDENMNAESCIYREASEGFLVHRLSYNASKGKEWNGESFGIRKTDIQGTPGHHG